MVLKYFLGGGIKKMFFFLIPSLQSWNTPRRHRVIRLFVAHYYDTLLWRTACCTGPFNQTNRWSVAHHHPSWPTTVFQERKKTLQLVLERERSDLSVTESSMCVTIMSFTCVTITWKALNLCHSCRVVTYLYIIIYIYICTYYICNYLLEDSQ